MTDYEQLVNLLNEFEIGYTEISDHNGTIIIQLMEGNNNIEGYAAFCSEWIFDAGTKEFIKIVNSE